MTSFGWRRKSNLRTSAAAVFADEEDEEEESDSDLVDWLTATKRRRAVLLEDAETKSRRLQEEGSLLAKEGRYWEALRYWDEALQLTPGSAVLHEMKSQVLMEVCEVFPAVQCAERAVELSPTWAIARQTLGRAQLGLGEVHLAFRNFQSALHLDPLNKELQFQVREEDLEWAQELLRQREAMRERLGAEEEAERNRILRERREGEPQASSDIKVEDCTSSSS